MTLLYSVHSVLFNKSANTEIYLDLHTLFSHDALRRSIRDELTAYSPILAEKPELVALNKSDAIDPDEIEAKTAALSRAAGRPAHLLSGVTGQGVREKSEEHTSELQSLMRTSYAVLFLKKKIKKRHIQTRHI